MPRFASRLAIAVIAALAAAAPAHAAWEAPQRLDQTAEGFGDAGAGDVAVGDNGLATIVFFQETDEGNALWATRRAFDAPSWLSPPWRVQAEPDSPVTIEAAPDGSTAGAYRDTETTDPTVGPPPSPGTTTHTVWGLGWPADQTTAPPKTGDLEDAGAPETPPVDADGRGFGWTAYVDASRNLQIVRFSIANPATFTKFTVPPVNRDPVGNRSLNETLSRSNPRVDANANGDVIVSFVERRRVAEPEPQQPEEETAVWAVRKLQSVNQFTPPQKMSHDDEPDPVTDHDPAIADNGDVTVLFAADPDRNASTPGGSPGPDRVFARRWLATSTTPRNPERGGIEFVSSSAADALDVSQLRAEAGPSGRVTAAWIQGASQLNSAERADTWTLPQTVSNNTAAYDIAVDAEGVATAVYRESTNARARRRGPSQQWAPADTLNSSAVPTDTAPRVDAGRPNQADAYLVQTIGTRRGAFATRFTGAAPVEPAAPVRPDTLDCPGDIPVQVGNEGANSIAGGDGRDTLLGRDGDDTLSGNGGDDCIRGEGGNDRATGGDGDDNVGGGDGDDNVAGGDGTDVLTGDAGTDRLDGDDGNDRATGGDGNDQVYGDDGTDVLNGDAGDDEVSGGGGDDLVGGDAGDDNLSGGSGTNGLFGGIGDDRIFGGPETDTIVGETGNDNITSGDGADNVNAGPGRDRVRGGNGRNTLDGAAGNDGMRGGSQSDRMRGSGGRDTLFGLAGHDRLLGGSGADKAYGGDGNDRLFGNSSGDRLRGGNGADRLYGGAGKDKLFGDSGKDRLSGGSRADVLNGGTSRDRISGGGGNDRISARDNKRDTIVCGKGRDRVVADRVDRVSRSCERVKRRR